VPKTTKGGSSAKPPRAKAARPGKIPTGSPKPTASRKATDARKKEQPGHVKLKQLLDVLQAGQDSYSNPLARLGVGTSSLDQGAYYPLTRWSNSAYVEITSLYRSSWIVRKVVDCIPEDMTKNWLTIEGEADPTELKQLDKAIDRTQTRARLLDAMKWGRLFGGAVAMMVIDGHEDMLMEPLDYEEVLPGAYKGLLVFDRWSGVSPSAEINEDINQPHDFGLPKYYHVQPEQGAGYNVHSSRLLRFIGGDLPCWERQAQMRWGISVLEPIIEEIRKRDNTSYAIANLIFRANLMILKSPTLAMAMSGIGTNTRASQNMQSILQAQNTIMSNQGMFVVDKDGDLTSMQYSFGGLSEMYAQFMLDICGACGIPMSRLFGRNPSGLGQANEGDEGVYDDLVTQKQARELRPQLDRLFPVICMSTWGKVPEDFDYRFNPIHSLNEQERADLAKSTMDSIIVAFNAGLISARTALMEIKQSAEVTGIGSNITDEDIAKADDQVHAAGEAPMGGGPLGLPPGDEQEPEPEEEEEAAPPEEAEENPEDDDDDENEEEQNPVTQARKGVSGKTQTKNPVGQVGRVKLGDASKDDAGELLETDCEFQDEDPEALLDAFRKALEETDDEEVLV
jgi:uncharacterized protein